MPSSHGLWSRRTWTTIDMLWSRIRRSSVKAGACANAERLSRTPLLVFNQIVVTNRHRLQAACLILQVVIGVTGYTKIQ